MINRILRKSALYSRMPPSAPAPARAATFPSDVREETHARRFRARRRHARRSEPARRAGAGQSTYDFYVTSAAPCQHCDGQPVLPNGLVGSLALPVDSGAYTYSNCFMGAGRWLNPWPFNLSA
jgi:hypothetical protein